MFTTLLKKKSWTQLKPLVWFSSPLCSYTSPQAGWGVERGCILWCYWALFAIKSVCCGLVLRTEGQQEEKLWRGGGTWESGVPEDVSWAGEPPAGSVPVGTWGDQGEERKEKVLLVFFWLPWLMAFNPGWNQPES